MFVFTGCLSTIDTILQATGKLERLTIYNLRLGKLVFDIFLVENEAH